MFTGAVMCTGKVVETQVVARTVIHKNTKLRTEETTTSSSLAFVMSVLGVAF